MKTYITEAQLNKLSEKQKTLALSYYRRQGQEKEPFNHKFWNIGRMIEFLNELILVQSLKTPVAKTGYLDFYGFNINNTPIEEWCDKLWAKVKKTISEEVKNNPHYFW